VFSVVEKVWVGFAFVLHPGFSFVSLVFGAFAFAVGFDFAKY